MVTLVITLSTPSAHLLPKVALRIVPSSWFDGVCGMARWDDPVRWDDIVQWDEETGI